MSLFDVFTSDAFEEPEYNIWLCFHCPLVSSTTLVTLVEENSTYANWTSFFLTIWEPKHMMHSRLLPVHFSVIQLFHWHHNCDHPNLYETCSEDKTVQVGIFLYAQYLLPLHATISSHWCLQTLSAIRCGIWLLKHACIIHLQCSMFANIGM